MDTAIKVIVIAITHIIIIKQSSLLQSKFTGKTPLKPQQPNEPDKSKRQLNNIIIYSGKEIH